MPDTRVYTPASPRQVVRDCASRLRPRVLASRLAALPSNDSGVALVFTIAVFLFLFVLVLSLYSIGEAIRQKEEVQNACDAAAHAGAVAQADDLSRIAVLNRAMSWNYVQMTKLQMDYITYSWLRVTCDKFAQDKKNCLKHTSPWLLVPDKTRGYAFIPDILDDIPLLSGLKTGSLGLPTKRHYIRWYIFDIGWATKWYVFNCYHNTHNNGNNRVSNYIGMRDGNNAANDGEAEEIRINGYEDLDDRCLRFHDGGLRLGMPLKDKNNDRLYGGDFDLVDGGNIIQSSILAEIENLYGGYGCPDLKEQIEGCKGRAGVYFALIADINKNMKDHITAAVRETLLQNLPRSGEDDPADATLLDYYWFCTGGTSIAPREYETADEAADGGEKKAYASYWSGLRNTEHDEMLFLNMADGLPGNEKVTLADYFKDQYTDPLEGGGLDQWFIRCRPEESQSSGEISVARDWVSPTPGIIRCYKNANYHDARSKSVILPDVHRGNYMFDGGSELVKVLARSIGEFFGNLKIPIVSELPVIGDKVQGFISDTVTKMVNNAIFPLSKEIGMDMTVPSVHNERESFPDTCAAIPESWGLVAEYEWSAAYWLCIYEQEGIAPLLGVMGIDLALPGVTKKWRYWKRHHWKKYKIVGSTDSISACFHFPFPLGAMCGGNYEAFSAGHPSPKAYNPGPFMGWVPEMLKNIKEEKIEVRGHSRNAYCAAGISIDGQAFKRGCKEGTLELLPNGKGSNTILKSYVRVYGDDKDAYDENYCGTPSMPWVLNENFFNGLGTIVVGLAKKRRNVFDLIVKDDISETSLHSAFSPPDGSHVVALAAARAAYAPRHGDKSADGKDTVNDNGGTRYDIHYDAVCRDLKPKLIRGDSPSADWERKAAKLESAPLQIGCVCTDDSGNNPSADKMAKTANRLRRQWNLCQTDWDGVLLPVRFTRAAIKEHNSNPTGQKRVEAGKDATPEWVESKKDYGDEDTIWELVQLLMTNLASSEEDSLCWRSFNGDGKASLGDLLDKQSPADEGPFTEAVRKRRVL